MPLLVICSIDRFGSTYPLAFALVYSETVDFYCSVMQQLNKVLIELTGNAQVATIITDRELALMRAISQEFSYTRHQLYTWHIFKNIRSKFKKLDDFDEFIKIIQKLAYDNNLENYQIDQEITKHINDSSNLDLENLRLVCSQFTFESFVKPQDNLVKSGTYEILENNNSTYNVMQIDNKVNTMYIVSIGTPNICTCLYPQCTRTPCQHIISVYLSFLHTCVLSSEIHQRWHVKHYLMQQVSIHVIENSKVPELLPSNSNTTHKSIFKTINIENLSYDDIKMLIVKRECGRLQNNKLSHSFSTYSYSSISQDMILYVYNPISDGHCGFRSLAVALFKDEKKWQDIKVTMKDQLTKQKELYNNKLGYNIDQLMAVLTCIEPICSWEFWFYSSECAQLASDTFNVPIVVFGADPEASLYFLPYNQKPGRRKKPIILQWEGQNHIVLVQIKSNNNA
ncbi:17364_t:CDS:2 [Gigaspora margarita]|uniref:17364_t:CDS:1 n=1 Tax=Gigaspora margarita TaxID=4874 RepID=A0ABN7WC07_GIGMA|nr:17364_t:CDS:2 [Gigaspora margarita]